MRSLLATAIVGLGSTACFATTGPVGHWSFNEGKGTVLHDSIAGNNGTAVGVPSFVPGVSGTALNFHRATGDCVDVGDLPLFDFPGASNFSVCLWIKCAENATDDQYPISNHFVTVPNGWLCFVGVSGGCYGDPARMSFYVSNSCGGEVTAAPNIYDGAWHHIVAVYDAGVAKHLYVDGGTGAVLGSPQSMGVHTLSRLVIGGVTNTNGQPSAGFEGSIDDVQIYDRALSCAEANYLLAHPGQPVALLADIDSDGDVDGADLATLLGAWGACGASCTADLDCSGSIDAADLAVLLGSWTG